MYGLTNIYTYWVSLYYVWAYQYFYLLGQSFSPRLKALEGCGNMMIKSYPILSVFSSLPLFPVNREPDALLLYNPNRVLGSGQLMSKMEILPS